MSLDTTLLALKVERGRYDQWRLTSTAHSPPRYHDRNSNMSGIEVTGLILASLPLVVGALERCRKGVSTSHSRCQKLIPSADVDHAGHEKLRIGLPGYLFRIPSIGVHIHALMPSITWTTQPPRHADE